MILPVHPVMGEIVGTHLEKYYSSQKPVMAILTLKKSLTIHDVLVEITHK